MAFLRMKSFFRGIDNRRNLKLELLQKGLRIYTNTPKSHPMGVGKSKKSYFNY